MDIDEELDVRRRMAKPDASESSSRRVAQQEDPPSLESKPLGAGLVDNVFAQVGNGDVYECHGFRQEGLCAALK